eukprot:gene12656-14628_t
MLETLSKILLCEVAHGKVVSEPFAASKLWSQAPAVVFVVDVDRQGVIDFQTKYFNLNELYLDQNRGFYKALGSKSLLSQPLHSWNPITLYKDFKKLMGRMKEKNIEGNMVGEGTIKGGLYVISPTDGIVYTHDENTGTQMPYAEIQAVVAKLLGKELTEEEANVKVSSDSDTAVCMSRETCGEN